MSHTILKESIAPTWKEYVSWGLRGLAAVTGATLFYAGARALLQGNFFNANRRETDTIEGDPLDAYQPPNPSLKKMSNTVELFSGSSLVPMCGERWQVNQENKNDQTKSVIAALDSESVIVLWQNQRLEDEANHDIHARVFDTNGMTLTDEWRVSQGMDHDHEFPSVTVLDKQRFAVTWTSTNLSDSSADVYAQVFYRNGTASTDKWQVPQSTDFRQQLSSVVALDSERLAFSWESSHEGSQEIYVRVFADNGSALTLHPHKETDKGAMVSIRRFFTESGAKVI